VSASCEAMSAGVREIRQIRKRFNGGRGFAVYRPMASKVVKPRASDARGLRFSETGSSFGQDPDCGALNCKRNCKRSRGCCQGKNVAIPKYRRGGEKTAVFFFERVDAWPLTDSDRRLNRAEGGKNFKS